MREWTWTKRAIVVGVVGLAPGCVVPSPIACEGEACEGGSGSGDTGGEASTAASATAADASTADVTTEVGSTDAFDDTGAPDPTTGGDTEPSDTTGEPPTQCPATHRCLAAAPTGWLGPVVRRTGLGDDVPPACSGLYSVDAGAHLLDPTSPAHSCDCDCGNPVGVACTTGIYHSSDATCGFPDPYVAVTNNNCIDIADTPHDYWMLNAYPSGGQCSAQSSVVVPDVQFGASVRFCEAQAAEMGCAAEELCLPIPSAPVLDVWCIVREGEHECPADGPYGAGGVRFTDFDDTRGCSTCSCGAPIGTCTGYTATLFTDDNCGIGAFGGSVDQECSLDTTSAAPTIRGLLRSGNANITAACTPAGGLPTGAFAPTEPITICCTD